VTLGEGAFERGGQAARVSHDSGPRVSGRQAMAGLAFPSE